MTPAVFLLVAVAAAPMIVVASTALTVAWYEAVWLPRIAGAE